MYTPYPIFGQASISVWEVEVRTVALRVRLDRVAFQVLLSTSALHHMRSSSSPSRGVGSESPGGLLSHLMNCRTTGGLLESPGGSIVDEPPEPPGSGQMHTGGKIGAMTVLTSSHLFRRIL